MDQRLHVYFDTTEISAKGGASPGIGRISSLRLREVRDKLGANFLVADLVATEVIQQRVRYLVRQLHRLESARKELRGVVDVPAAQMPSQDDLENTCRLEVEGALRTKGLETIPVEENTSLLEILRLSTKRVPPFKGEDDPKGFHDAVTLVTSLKHAARNGLAEMIFVSTDEAYTEDFVKLLGEQYGVSARLVKGVDALADLMTAMDGAHLKSLIDQVVKDTTAFMQGHIALILKLIEEKPPALRHFFTPSPLQSPPNKALSISVKDIFAIPASERVEGKECSIDFIVRVLGEFEFLEFEFDSRPLADHPVLPGTTFQGAASMLLIPSWGTGVPKPRLAVRRAEARYLGKAVAKFEGGRFVGDVEIEKFEPQEPGGFGSLLNPYSGVGRAEDGC